MRYFAILGMLLTFVPSVKAEVTVVPASAEEAENVFSNIVTMPVPPPRVRRADRVRQHQQYAQYQSALDTVRQRLSAAFDAERGLFAQATARQVTAWQFNEAAFLVAGNKLLEMELRLTAQLTQEDAVILAGMTGEQRLDIAAYHETHGYSCEARTAIPGEPAERPENKLNCRMQATLKAATFNADTYKEIIKQRSAIRYEQDRENLKVYASRYASQSFFERNPCWGWPVFHNKGNSCWP